MTRHGTELIDTEHVDTAYHGTFGTRHEAFRNSRGHYSRKTTTLNTPGSLQGLPEIPKLIFPVTGNLEHVQ